MKKRTPNTERIKYEILTTHPADKCVQKAHRLAAMLADELCVKVPIYSAVSVALSEAIETRKNTKG